MWYPDSPSTINMPPGLDNQVIILGTQDTGADRTDGRISMHGTQHLVQRIGGDPGIIIKQPDKPLGIHLQCTADSGVEPTRSSFVFPMLNEGCP